MKIRFAWFFMLVAGIGGLAWWLRQPPGGESSSTQSPVQKASVPPSVPAATAEAPAATPSLPTPPIDSPVVAPSREIVAPPANLAVTPPNSTQPPATISAPPAPSSPGLKYTVGPDNGAELVLATFQDSVRSGRSPNLQRVLAGVDLNSLTVTPPIAVYDLRYNEVAGGGKLDDLVSNQFLYIVEANGGPIAAGFVWPDDNGGARVSSMTYGASPFVRNMVSALASAAALEPVRTGAYEPRFLRSGTSTIIWLKSESGGPDLVYPASPPAGIQNKIYTADEFMSAFHEAAQRQTQQINANGRPPPPTGAGRSGGPSAPGAA